VMDYTKENVEEHVVGPDRMTEDRLRKFASKADDVLGRPGERSAKAT